MADTTATSMSATGLPDTTAVAVWSHLQQVDYRANWQMWPGKERLYRGQDPHGALLTTYLNTVAHGALTARASSMPANAIIVKENYAPDSTLAATTVMYKVNGYNPSANDWYWVKFLPDGGVDGQGAAQGRVDGCIQCHGGQRANDYIMTGSLGG
jgi:hypothetical protein